MKSRFSKIHGLMVASLIATPMTFAKGFDVRTLTTLDSIHSSAVSPDGTALIYGLKAVNDKTTTSNLFLKRLNQSESDLQLTNHVSTEHSVVWSHDGSSVYFISSRSGTPQVWNLALTGGEAKQVTDLPLSIEGFKLASDGSKIVLSISTFLGCESLNCSADKFAAQKAKPNAGKVYNQLMVRHWDTWKDGSYKHLYVADITNTPITKVTDVTAGLATDSPAKPFSGMEEVTFTPDNKHIVYTAKAPSVTQASHTNYDLWQVDVSGKTRINLTANNKAWDAHPTFSPDGRYMAYVAMEKPGAESDRFAIMLKDLVTGTVKEVAPLWDRSARQVMFAPDSRNLIVTAQDIGQVSVFMINIQFGDIKQIQGEGSSSIIGVAGNDVVIKKKALNNPGQLYKVSFDGAHVEQLTHVNKEKLKDVDFGQFSQFSFKGWNDETVYGYWVKPSDYKAGEKYPVAFLIHGGPQGSFGNSWSTRWNPQLWAGAGYGVVMIDFHGSTGYGQQFTDSINQDWGGKPLEDLQKGLTAVTNQQPWLDSKNACALGASYGGYMVNWIAGNWNDQFKCLVNHAGLFDMRMFYNVTEELWFPGYDFGGSYAQVPDNYEKFNPVNYVKNWKTPMLVIHGEKDFRVPYGQGLAAFTTLQNKKIESQLIVFPQENHWILNNDNKIQWYDAVINWMDKFTK